MQGNHKIKTFKKGETEHTIMENHQFKKLHKKKAIHMVLINLFVGQE